MFEKNRREIEEVHLRNQQEAQGISPTGSNFGASQGGPFSTARPGSMEHCLQHQRAQMGPCASPWEYGFGQIWVTKKRPGPFSWMGDGSDTLDLKSSIDHWTKVDVMDVDEYTFNLEKIENYRIRANTVVHFMVRVKELGTGFSLSFSNSFGAPMPLIPLTWCDPSDVTVISWYCHDEGALTVSFHAVQESRIRRSLFNQKKVAFAFGTSMADLIAHPNMCRGSAAWMAGISASITM